MHTRNRCRGKVSVWIACITALLSAAFIVLIVNRDSLAVSWQGQMEQAAVPQTAYQPSPKDESLGVPDIQVALLRPTVDLRLETSFTLQAVPLPKIEVEVRRPSVVVSSVSSKEVVNNERFQLAMREPFGISEALSQEALLQTEATVVLASLKDLNRLATIPVSAGYKPSVLVRGLEQPQPEPQQRVFSQETCQIKDYSSGSLPSKRLASALSYRLHDAQARLYLSDLKLAIYEGHSRDTVKAMWEKMEIFLRTHYFEPAEFQTLQPELTRVEKAMASRMAARKLIFAVDALQKAMDEHAAKRNSKHILSLTPY